MRPNVTQKTPNSTQKRPTIIPLLMLDTASSHRGVLILQVPVSPDSPHILVGGGGREGLNLKKEANSHVSGICFSTPPIPRCGSLRPKRTIIVQQDTR